MDVANAQAELKKIYEADASNAPFRDGDGEPSWDGVVVCASITRANFRDWLNRHEGELRRWNYEPLSPDTGRVIVYSFPTTVHEHAAGEIMAEIRELLAIFGGNHINRTLIDSGTITVDVGDREQQPNRALTPAELVLPTLIVEVACRNDSRRFLEEKLLRWMRPNTSVQVAIGVKTFCSRRRLAILHVRGGLTQCVEFGTDTAVQPPQPLVFPLRALYTGSQIPTALAGHANGKIAVDLVPVRRMIDLCLAQK